MEALAIYGTLGPNCHTEEQIKTLFQLGMTGMRLNLSHTDLADHPDWLSNFQKAKQACRADAQLLIDMKGPEIRIGELEPLSLINDTVIEFTQLSFPKFLLSYIHKGQEIVLDDGNIVLEACDRDHALVKRGGILTSNKGVALVGKNIQTSALTSSDIENLKAAKMYGVTGIMQPFVRSVEDLKDIQKTFQSLGIKELKVYAKIENQLGLDVLESLFPYCDEIIIARGDLGSSIGIVELPSVQHRIEVLCRKHRKPYMVGTQMLHSMIEKAVPTRAEVSDIYWAVYNGASSIMLTGETAVGKYPIEAMKVMVGVAYTALRDRCVSDACL